MHALRRVRLALSFPRPCASSRSPGGSASLEKYRLLNGTFARGCDFLCFFFFSPSTTVFQNHLESGSPPTAETPRNTQAWGAPAAGPTLP